MKSYNEIETFRAGYSMGFKILDHGDVLKCIEAILGCSPFVRNNCVKLTL